MIVFFYNNSPGDTSAHDSKKLRFQDSTAVAGALAQKIFEASNQAANGTYLMYNTLKKTKGIDQFLIAYRRVTGSTYYDATWGALKNTYVGTWAFYGSGVTTHQFVVNDTGDAERVSGTPKYKGKVRVWSDNRVELLGYLETGKSIIFDFVERLPTGQNVFMSQDGSKYIYK